MPKLNDTQLVILSAAAARDDGAVLPLPGSLKLKGGAVNSVLEGLRKKGLVDEKPAAPGDETWREAKDGHRMALVITDAGREAIDGRSAGPRSAQAAKKPQPKPAVARAKKEATAKARPRTSTARTGTKQSLLIDLLDRKNGATIDEIVAVTGWQPHSVRGAISGSIKKKLGLTVTSETDERRGRVYRIVH